MNEDTRRPALIMEWMMVATLFLGCAFAANSVLTVSSELPTPTPSPTPSPAPSELIPVNTFVGHDKEGNGSECLYLSAGIQLLVNYTNRDELENTSLIVVRKNPRVEYDNHATVCGEKNSIMTVAWTHECSDSDSINDTYLLIFEFGIDSVQQTWEMLNVTFKFVTNKCDFPNIDVKIQDEFSFSLNHGIMDRNASHCHFYGCDAQKTFAFDTNSSSVITGVVMLVQDLRMEALCSRLSTFNETIDHHFGEWCAEDHRTNPVLSIAVGAAIGGLLAVVLIIFVIGWITSRSKRIGYEKLQ